jgi:hypothetical protein
MKATMPFTTLTEDEEKELWRLNRFYWKEARRCEEAKAYLAGCVMLGSSLENILILMISLYSEDADRTGKVPRRKDKPKPVLKWDLGELIAVAKAAGWLPAGLKFGDGWNARKARVGDYAEVARQMRNLAHPARYLQDHPRGRVTKRYLQRQFEIVLACRDWLAAHNNRELLKAIDEEEKRERAQAPKDIA